MEAIREASKAVRLEGLQKTFPGRQGREVVAVSDVTLDARPGELLTLLGPSGCGKTTVLRIIAGLESPTRGVIFIGDAAVNDLPPYKRNVGLVFQSYALFPHLTVFENAAYALRIRRVPEPQIRHEVSRILELLGLEAYSSRLPAQLSGGEQQRVALARALVSKPAVLLFDEPLSNLDAKLRVQVRGEVRRIHRQLGTTAIYVTHDQAEAMSLSDRIAVMHAGRVEQIGTPQEIYRAPSSAFVAEFIGRSNFLSSRVRARRAGVLVVDFLDGTAEVGTWVGEPASGDPIVLLLRPEAVQVVAAGKGDTDGVLRSLDYQGATADAQVEVNGHLLMATLDLVGGGEVPGEGTRVGLQFRREALHAIPASTAPMVTAPREPWCGGRS